MMDELKPFFDALQEELNGQTMEEGDQYSYVGKNCLVIFEMQEGHNLSVQVIGGRPKEVDAALSIFGEE